jgi:(4-(4-[2-(gamma-L-glutamylamino)ethyl]phenoxymethyl)furan-2-yl)methanamine synthase
MSNILALDIGGANIKVANGRGYARSWPFALWKAPDLLAEKLKECLAAAPQADEIAITMTGELCDCFETKREGVESIVQATQTASRLVPSPVTAGPVNSTSVSFYQTTGKFVSAYEACENHLLTAASNWHALATFAAKYCEIESAILVDIGSTTTDIIPIENGSVVARGHTDPERLQSGELVYAGVERTPVCALIPYLKWRGSNCPLAKELFATTGDAYLLTGELPEDESNRNTPDGKPFTYAAAHARMARIICSDKELSSLEDVTLFANEIRGAQLTLLARTFDRVASYLTVELQAIILSGHGEFLGHRLVGELGWWGTTTSLTRKLGPEVSRCACAHALAVLARE